MRIGFTPREVIRLTGVPYSTLNLWAKKGLIVPSISDGSGSGNERIYDFSDLIALRVAFELRKAGVSTRSLQKIIDFVRKSGQEPKSLAQARLVVIGSDVLEVQNDEQLVSALRNPGQAFLSFVVDLQQTFQELTEVLGSPDPIGMAISDPLSTRRKPPASAGRELGKRQKK